MLARRRVLRSLVLLVGGVVACDRAPDVPALLPAGAQLPELRLPTVDGHLIEVRGDAGGLLLNFWATWCPPCRAEMAALERLHREYAGQGLRVMAVSVDTDRFLVQEYLLQTGLSFPVVIDPSGAATVQPFRVTAFPTTYQFDSAGRMVRGWVGEVDWDSAAVRQAVTKGLSGQAA